MKNCIIWCGRNDNIVQMFMKKSRIFLWCMYFHQKRDPLH